MDAPAAPSGRPMAPAACGPSAAKLEPTSTDDKRCSGASTSAGDVFPAHADQMLPPSYPTKAVFSADGTLDMEYDYEGTVRASYYGRRIYPSYDPANPRACPVRFIRQFEHAAQHNGLHMRAWAKRMDSCLHGRAEDWAFDECPLVMAGASWDARKRQFLDWALLPAEQELRRQRLMRFYQAESDLSIDFVYTFEEAAVGLRDYKEDVWARKCISNLLPPIRSGLFEFWTDGLPVRFRDLRDSLYAVDWSLYETASAPLRVVKYGAQFAYEACCHPPLVPQPPPSSATASACSSTDRPPTTRLPVALSSSAPNIPHGAAMYSPPAPSPHIIPTTRRRRTGASTMPTAHARALASGLPVAVSSGSSPAGSSGNHSYRESSDGTRSPGTSTGLGDLISTLARIPERDRSMLVAALGKVAAADEGSAAGVPAALDAATSPRSVKSRGRLSGMSSPTALPLSTSTNGKSRAATAAAVAAAAHQFASMDTTMRPTITSGATNIESYLLKAADVSQSSSSGSDAAAVAAAAETPASGDRQLRPPSARGSSESTDDNGKIRLRTRPLTSMTYETRRRSSPLLSIHGGDCDVSASPKPLGRPGDGDGANGGRGGHQPAGAATPGAASSARRTHARKLSSRKSDSALTTTARSHRRGGGYRDDSSDDNMRSPEFTVLHPDLKRRTNSRRGRFASALLRLLR